VVIRCIECGPAKLFCGKCDQDIHCVLPLHDRELWKDGYFQPIPPTTVCLGGEVAYQGKYILLDMLAIMIINQVR